eukprot:6190244-Pleurochrysis_carterae.AAC.1
MAWMAPVSADGDRRLTLVTQILNGTYGGALETDQIATEPDRAYFSYSNGAGRARACESMCCAFGNAREQLTSETNWRKTSATNAWHEIKGVPTRTSPAQHMHVFAASSTCTISVLGTRKLKRTDNA